MATHWWRSKDELISNILLWTPSYLESSLHSFTIHAVCLEHFGAEGVQKGKDIRTANRRQREKGRLRVEQRLLKNRLKEMPNDREFMKKQLSEVKEKILVIIRAENGRKRRQKKRKARSNFEKNLLKFSY